MGETRERAPFRVEMLDSDRLGGPDYHDVEPDEADRWAEAHWVLTAHRALTDANRGGWIWTPALDWLAVNHHWPSRDAWLAYDPDVSFETPEVRVGRLAPWLRSAASSGALTLLSFDLPAIAVTLARHARRWNPALQEATWSRAESIPGVAYAMGGNPGLGESARAELRRRALSDLGEEKSAGQRVRAAAFLCVLERGGWRADRGEALAVALVLAARRDARGIVAFLQAAPDLSEEDLCTVACGAPRRADIGKALLGHPAADASLWLAMSKDEEWHELLARHRRARKTPSVRDVLRQSERSDALLALLVDAEESEVRGLLGRLARTYPARLLGFLECAGPLCPATIRPEHLTPLFAHRDARIRERALRTVGRLPSSLTGFQARGDDR